MKLVLNNPYRILGLLVGATAREQQSNKHKIKIYLDADQEIPNEIIWKEFNALGEILRSNFIVDSADAKLNHDSDKMSAALFWFYDGKTALKSDEDTFKAMKESDLEQVINIWTKLTSNREVSQQNASAYSNLATLYLSGILEGTNTNEAVFEQGISLKLKFLESSFYKELQHLATDEKIYKPTKKELQLLFLNQVQSDVEKSGTLTSNKFLDILTKLEFSAKEDFLKGFVQKPIEEIEKKVEEAKAKRKENKANGINIGKALFEQTSENFNQLNSILGPSNLRFSSISDKVSEEILQCGIDYFSLYKDSSTDPGSASMELLCKAETLAIGNILKQRCQENIENLQQWINEKPEREKIQKLEKYITEINNKIEFVQTQREINKLNIVNIGVELYEFAVSKLIFFRNTIGAEHIIYKSIANKVSEEILQCGIIYFNYFKDSNVDSGSVTIDILTKAQICAADNSLKETCKKNINYLKKWINEKPEREKIQNIETIIKELKLKIKTTKKIREQAHSNIPIAGVELYDFAFNKRIALKNIIGENHIIYERISDEVSNEILQCGIVYFNHFHNSNMHTASVVIDLLYKAITIAIGNITKQTCQEKIEELQEWISGKDERDKITKIKTYFDNITCILKDIETKSKTIENAKFITNKCRSDLQHIKKILGNADDLYLKISTQIVAKAEEYIVTEINEIQDKLRYNFYNKNEIIKKLEIKLPDAWGTTIDLGYFDMTNEQKQHYTKNKSLLKALQKQINGNIIFIGDITVNKWFIWCVGFLFFILLLITCS